MSKRIICPRTGIDYSCAEEMEFYNLLVRGNTTETLIFAARHYKKIGTYALDRAVDGYERQTTETKESL